MNRKTFRATPDEFRGVSFATKRGATEAVREWVEAHGGTSPANIVRLASQFAERGGGL